MRNQKTLIVRSLLAHGFENFDIFVLEYCTKKNLIFREQFYLDTLGPSLNLAKQAGNTLNVLHTSEARAKISLARTGSRHTEEVKAFMSASRKGAGNPMFGKTLSTEAKAHLTNLARARKIAHNKGFLVKVQNLSLCNASNLNTAGISYYSSLRATAPNVGGHYGTLKSYNGYVFKQKYLINVNLDDPSVNSKTEKPKFVDLSNVRLPKVIQIKHSNCDITWKFKSLAQAAAFLSLKVNELPSETNLVMRIEAPDALIPGIYDLKRL